MLLGYFVMLPDDFENLSQSVIATNIFGNNILAAITTKNYWDVSNDFKPLMHTWYVGVVMQFYLIYPIMFLLFRQTKNSKRSLLIALSTLAFISLLIYLGIEDDAQRFYYLPSRFYEFAVGGIVALVYKPSGNQPFGKVFVYVCYLLMLALMAVNVDIIPANLRLMSVVALTVVLICSQDVLENKVTGNSIIAKIGAASYSIFIWHQILLAFCRYVLTDKFTITTCLCLLVATAVLSWLSYKYIEQKTTQAIKSKKGKSILYIASITVFVVLNAYAGFIYLRAGVVRDVPELYISKNDIHRGMHAEYVDRGFQYDKPFETDKPHWYIIGNSFGRDFVNVILESPIADSVEVSYSPMNKFRSEMGRFKKADRVFLSTLGLKEELVTEVEILSMANGLTPDNVIIVGEKNFGASNGQIYAKRHEADYFEQYIDVDEPERYIELNKTFAEKYGERYLDLMSMVLNEHNQVRVFSPDHHYISADCGHFSRGGAIYFGELINWNRYINR